MQRGCLVDGGGGGGMDWTPEGIRVVHLNFCQELIDFSLGVYKPLLMYSLRVIVFVLHVVISIIQFIQA